MGRSLCDRHLSHLERIVSWTLQQSQEAAVAAPRVYAHLIHSGCGFRTQLCPAPVNFHGVTGKGHSGLRRQASRDAGDTTEASGSCCLLGSTFSLHLRTCHPVLLTYSYSESLRSSSPRTPSSGQKNPLWLTERKLTDNNNN